MTSTPGENEQPTGADALAPAPTPHAQQPTVAPAPSGAAAPADGTSVAVTSPTPVPADEASTQVLPVPPVEQPTVALPIVQGGPPPTSPSGWPSPGGPRPSAPVPPAPTAGYPQAPTGYPQPPTGYPRPQPAGAPVPASGAFGPFPAQTTPATEQLPPAVAGAQAAPQNPFSAPVGVAAGGYGGQPVAPPPAGDGAAGAPAGRRPGPRTGVVLLVAVVVSALVAGLTTFGVLQVTGRSTARPASIADLGQSTQAPIEGSSVAGPSWEAVAKAVKASVVAIAVSTSQGEAEGSGVVLDAKGHVLTNNHVVDGAVGGKVQVTLNDGRIFDATTAGTDSTTDLAVVTLTSPPSDLRPAALGDSANVVVGEQVMAVGNPLGLQNTVTTGIVSALDRPVTTSTTSTSSDVVVTNAIQVDAAINPGNSGGPLFDGAGKVIGITSSIASLSPSATAGSTESGSIGLGFAIPVNLAKDIGSQLIAHGTAEHAFLGVRLTDANATADGVTRRGAKVGQVTAGSPADKAGIKAGDVIVALGSNPTPGADSLTAYVRSMRAGDKVKVTFVRGAKSLEVDVTLAAKAEQATTSPQPTPSTS